MTRRLLNLLTALSLLLCVAALVSLSASYRVPHSLPLYRADREWRLVFNGGTVQLWHTRRLDLTSCSDDGTFTVEEVPLDYVGPIIPRTDRITWWSIDLDPWSWPPVASSRTMTGGGVQNPDGREFLYGVEAEVRAVPHWLVAAPLLLLPALRLMRRLGGSGRRSRRLSGGLCPDCGYDLRATSGRCPECGTVAPATPTGTPAKGGASRN